MAQIVGIASLGTLLALAAMTWQNSQPQQTDAIAGVSPVWLSVGGKSLPQQHIQDQTLIFVGP